MSRKILGLDIRSNSATAILMETGLKKSAVSGFGHAPFPEDGTYHERLAETLLAISREMDLKDCVCAMSVPSDRFFYRNVSVPFSETKKIQQMLPYELESEIPFSVEDLLIDFNKVPLPANEGDTRIIAAGIETERLNRAFEAAFWEIHKKANAQDVGVHRLGQEAAWP
jgi:Tfp pilus assembly PilM family ATPase